MSTIGIREQQQVNVLVVVSIFIAVLVDNFSLTMANLKIERKMKAMVNNRFLLTE